jgi:hypothetical protein
MFFRWDDKPKHSIVRIHARSYNKGPEVAVGKSQDRENLHQHATKFSKGKMSMMCNIACDGPVKSI